MGEIVIECFLELFLNLMDFDFMVCMEDELDEIVEGDVEWKKVLNDFFGKFWNQFEIVESVEDGGMWVNILIEIDILCFICSCNMQICVVSIGVFLGCLGYLLLFKECCKIIINLVLGDEVVSVDDDVEGEGEIWLLCKK